MRIRFAPESELQDWVDRGQREAAAALALDPNLAEVHEARAAVARYLEFDWDLAINESDRALALNPSLENPHFYRAAAFYHFGLFDRARTEIRLGMENNPVNRVEPLRLLGTTQLLAGQFADAESTLRGAQGLSHQEVTSTYLAQALYHQGKKTDAEQMLAALTGSNSAQARRRAQATLASYLGAKNERVKARALDRRRARRFIYGSPRRLQSGRRVCADWRSWRSSPLADAGGSGRLSLLSVVRQRSTDAVAQVRSCVSGIHEAAEQPVRRESCPLWRLTKPPITSPRGPRSHRFFSGR